MVPDYQSLMLPLLQALSDGETHHIRALREHLARKLNLDATALADKLPSGRQSTFNNRVGWAKTYLDKAGLLETPARAQLRITPLGRKVLQERPAQINNLYLLQFSGFQAFRGTPTGSEMPAHMNEPAQLLHTQDANLTPDEVMEKAYSRLQKEVENQLLQSILSSSPSFFEQLVVDLLVRMGYGGSLEDAGHAIGGSGDDGIDGIIKEDRLGLDTIYIQAKRWTDKTVGRPDVQGFAGSLQGARARKGVFITTSRFSAEAKDFVSRIDSKIVLIDGPQLVRLMFEHGLGVSTNRSYHIKRIDQDYFEEA